jgi:hypothetical protein
MLPSEGQAKRFFVDKIVAEAIAEGQPLSDTQRYMLSWSESDSQFDAKSPLAEQFKAEISDEQYEAKVAGLIQRAYRRHLASDSGARDLWREAYSTLSQGDHYLLVMLSRGVSRQLRPWWNFWS